VSYLREDQEWKRRSTWVSSQLFVSFDPNKSCKNQGLTPQNTQTIPAIPADVQADEAERFSIVSMGCELSCATGGAKYDA
jgi:hypothetical protein